MRIGINARAIAVASVILSSCVLLDAALLIPLKTMTWGYLEDIPLLFVSLAALATQFVCLSAVCALQIRSWWRQILCLAIVLSTAYLVGKFADESGVEVLVTSVLISYGFFTTMRLVGWRFAWQSSPLSWQFSLAEFLLVVTLLGLFLGLLRWGGTRQNLPGFDGWIVTAPFFIGLVISVAYGSMTVRIWRALAVALVVAPLGVFLALAFVFIQAPVIAVINMTAGGMLVPIILAVRGSGIQLVHVSKLL
jgi:hypothetical protein